MRFPALMAAFLSLSVSVCLFAQPTIVESFNPANVQIGQRSTLTFTINNPAASAISAVAFTDNFPAHLFVANPNSLTGSCGSGTIAATGGSGSVSLSGGTIAAGGSCTFSIDVIVLHQSTNSASYINTTSNVTASSGTGNTATDTLTAGFGTFAVTKGFSPNSIPAGGVSTLVFTVTSSQPNPTSPFIDQVADLVFQDVLPAGLVVASPNGLNLGTCAPASPVVTAAPGSNTITLGNQPLFAGGGNTGGITLTNSGGAFDTCSFSVDVTAAAAGSYLNTVTTSFGGAYPLVSNDGNNGSATLNVGPSNAPPVAVDDNALVAENSVGNAINVLANDSDPDGDTLTITAVTQGSHGSVVNNGTSVSYTPAAAFSGSDSFTYTIDDGHGHTATATVHVRVNAPPQANDDTYSVNENTALAAAAPGVLSNDTDPDGDAITAVLVSSPSHGTLTFHADGSFTYTPNAHFACTDSFTYKANDGLADSNVATVTIHVADTEGPAVTASVSQTVLWPANHDLVNVGLAFTASDNGCGTAATAVTVFSDEPDVFNDGGQNFSPDAKDLAAGTLRLRAERANSTGGNGRVYLVRVTATDSSSNTSSKCLAVVVPASNSAAAINDVTARALAAANQCTATGLPPAGYVAIGTGPVIGPKQ